MNEQGTRLLIVGNPQEFHAGAHFRDAANDLQIPAALCDTRAAFDAPAPERILSWRLRGKRPPRLEAFGARVARACAEFKPTHLLATGIAPLNADALARVRAQKIRTMNFLTDDPWSANQRAGWFLRALPLYDAVFTPRRANMDDLTRGGCARVEFLMFAYNPRVHFPDAGAGDELASDVLFAGGGDADRLPFLAALTRSGFRVRLYGGYWDRYPETRAVFFGHATLETLRRAVRQARVCLNLVRRANRDGNVMRTFEAPAMGGCVLCEDTADHRVLFGDGGECVLYFNSPQEAVTQARRLCEDGELRARLGRAAHARITQGENRYADRLRVMLGEREQRGDF
jgi:hypothetical protein